MKSFDREINPSNEVLMWVVLNYYFQLIGYNDGNDVNIEELNS